MGACSACQDIIWMLKNYDAHPAIHEKLIVVEDWRNQAHYGHRGTHQAGQGPNRVH